jgi:hypothetical protein
MNVPLSRITVGGDGFEVAAASVTVGNSHKKRASALLAVILGSEREARKHSISSRTFYPACSLLKPMSGPQYILIASKLRANEVDTFGQTT